MSELPEGHAERGRFADLPEEVRRRIYLRGDAIGNAISSYVVQILIGSQDRSQLASAVYHASGVWVAFKSGPILFTAQHVLKGYRERTANGPTVFQVGNVTLDVEERLVFESVAADLAALQLLEEELVGVPSRGWVPKNWPPLIPEEGDWVGHIGFPREYRMDGGPGFIDLPAVGGILRIDVTGGDFLGCTYPRSRLVHTRGPGVPPQGANLKGMSGGPVFLVNPADDSIALVGIVVEDSPGFDLFRFSPIGQLTQLAQGLDESVRDQSKRLLLEMGSDSLDAGASGSERLRSLVSHQEMSAMARVEDLSQLIDAVANLISARMPHWDNVSVKRAALLRIMIA